jgi:DNA (cytosine-5)-methyltransferase 1
MATSDLDPGGRIGYDRPIKFPPESLGTDMTQYDDAIEPGTRRRPTVAELFAGVGGFHLALDRAGFDVVWSNQWEPSTKAQHAFACYEQHVRQGDFQRYGRDLRGLDATAPSTLDLSEHQAVNEDIATVLDRFAAERSGPKKAMFPVIPDIDVLVGGFPCQDYSVAKTLRQAHGLVGRKGVLWWEIHRLLRLKLESGRPVRWLFLENVDRLLKSPSGQRGRDFAVMLASLADLGYEVEWRVINAANYGFPQKRRRVFIVGRHAGHDDRLAGNPEAQMMGREGVLARAFPVQPRAKFDWAPILLDRDVKVVSDTFGTGATTSAFGNAGVMRISGTSRAPAVWTADVDSVYADEHRTLRDILEDAEDVPEQFFVSAEELPNWQFLKGRKSLSRISKATGLEYTYDEGAIPFPDPIDTPSRTILTGEGGATPSRFKHIIKAEDGRFRRLTPRELERLNGFPGDWTVGMSDGRRAFMMGNALVVGAIEKVADELADEIAAGDPRVVRRVAEAR